MSRVSPNPRKSDSFTKKNTPVKIFIKTNQTILTIKIFSHKMILKSCFRAVLS